MRLDDRTGLARMVEACDEIGRFVADRRAEDCETDRTLLLARVRAPEAPGEAANGVSGTLREGTPSVPWRQIVATRHRLIHGYLDVDPEIVWKTVTEEVAALPSELRSALEGLD